MLRTLLGEPPRVNTGDLKEAIDTMAETLQLLGRAIEKGNDPSHDYRKLEIWTRGLITSLDELEQSSYAASFFAQKVHSDSTEDMAPDEKADYARYVYFYKDGFIRMFAILDKLGNLLDDWYDLHTSKVKVHFSYFTVLRQFEYLKQHKPLLQNLNDLKEQYSDPMNRLRKRRNTEIHHMNVEMVDDLWQKHQTLNGKLELEDLKAFTEDLEQGLTLVAKSLTASFRYINENWKNNK
ncbi:Cthe_2314 family HEPN domain-containing protein [Neobacillus mesonae]|nr:Cthe_2314 family HEPN domain-containing protein [Neobacillus mesonae]